MIKHVYPWLQLLRPHQWIKNLMLLFPLFLSGKLLPVDSYFSLLLPIFSFSMASSAIYIINDIFDIKQDIHHPVKKHRPLPAGKIKNYHAFITVLLLSSVSFLAGIKVSTYFLQILLLYVLISIIYSIILKLVPIAEIFCIVAGFLLRLEAGGIAYKVHISDWLFLSVFLLAMFLVSGKRLSELMHSKGQPPELIRPVLSKYPDNFFQASMYISGAAVLVTYTMYVITHQNNILLIPLCCFGLLQYIFRVLSGRGGDPTRSLLKDHVLLIVGITWVIMVGVDIYW